MTTVTWTQDVNSNYEVSSPEHLKQIMHKGALYTDAGSPPSSYWAAGTNYKQTADIDLLSDSTDIRPIGVAGDGFSGEYDGGEFKISNWSYVDPAFAANGQCEDSVGLFGYTDAANLSNVRLNGLWTIQGFYQNCGFLVGYHDDLTSSGTRGVRNIQCDFARGSKIDTTYLPNGGPFLGAIAGRLGAAYVYGLTVRGFLDFTPAKTQRASYVGGVVGVLEVGKNAAFLHNAANFSPQMESGNYAGGVVGAIYQYTNPISDFLNTMIGDIHGERIGGVIGQCRADDPNETVDRMVNAMTGNIVGTGTGFSDGAAGIIGYVPNLRDQAFTQFINYMTGDISSSNGTAGGLLGYFGTFDGGGEINSCINAMNGDVSNAIIGFETGTEPFTLSGVSTNTDFGLTFTADGYGSSSPPTGMLTSSGFTDLPYIAMSGTDDIGNSYDFDFVYANLSGNSSYSAHTHLVLHKGDISTPFGVDFDIPANNSTVYLTYINGVNKTVTPNGLTILSIDVLPPLAVEQRSINIPVVIQEVTGATAYQITYEGPTGGEIVAFSGSTDLTYNIVGVEPDTTYTIKLYADTGAGLELSEQLSTTTLPNLAANYDITEFQDTNGVTDLTSLDASTLSNISSVIPELVNTGDVVSLSLVSNPELTTTSFVSLGGILDVTGIDGVLLPFQDTSGAGQTANITLSDNTTVPISYNESTSSITVESTPYSAGDSFVLQGNDVEVFDYYGLTVISIDEIIPLALEPRSINIPVTIAEVPGAIAYQITYEGPTGGEITAVSGVTTLEHNITGLEPDTAYTIKLYADTGTGYELTEELTTTTLPNVAANYDITDFQEENGVTDLTSLDATTLSNLSSVLTELVNTGDVVNVSLPNEPDLATSFVAVGENINIADVDGLLLPFDTTSGASQTVTLTLSDTTTVPVTYDEVANTISVESVTYSSGDAIYLDGNKLEVFDYYGLTVVSVDVAPLLVEPGPINIPVVIAEVPGAVGYNVTYEGPTGGEMTAFSGATTLEQNITGLVSGTEYTIKLYADTGSGYVLTEELTATTLPNVATNYDVNIFVEDGVINLSSLPDATISNIAEVMNELFTTGDLVSVSLQGKPELNTSFINLGDELSIDAIDGVLLPFVEASTPGQDVSVVLSDGSTTVGINFDEVVNTITVNNVVYSPGDSFVLDGKKVTVVEY